MAYTKKKYTPPAPVVRTPFAPKFPPSTYQQSFFDSLGSGGNKHIEAVAGSGKTTTILWAMSLLDSKSKAYLAFNKSIVSEIEPRCDNHTVVKTGHSYGFSPLIKNYKTRLDKYKTKNIIKEIIPSLDPDKCSDDERGSVYKDLMETEKLVHFIKVSLTDWKDDQAVMMLIIKYDIDIDNIYEVISNIPKIMDKCLDFMACCDFDDMIWLTVMRELKLDKFDHLFVDECQDLSPMMQRMAGMMLNEGGQIYTVGDRMQAIYGFAGADCNAVDNLVEKFGSNIHPLSVCYRCPQSVIIEAQRICPDMKWRDGAPEGEVIRDKEDSIKYEELEDGTMVLARRNSSLIGGVFKCIKANRKAFIKGQDIGERLARQAEEIKADTITSYLVKLEDKREKKLEVISKRKGSDTQVDVTNDIFDCIKHFAENLENVRDIGGRIRYIFTDNSTTGITFSSMHRSKGLEADTVVLMDSNNLRLKCKMSEDQEKQESNLEYVATTRAMKKLIYKYKR